MSDKIKPTARQLRTRQTIRYYVKITVLAFLAFACFDLADGEGERCERP